MRGGRRLLALGCCVIVTVSGCAFQGVNSLPLPGAVGRGGDAAVYHVELANVGTLESNSPVLIDDVVVGSVGKMTTARLARRRRSALKPDVVVPANAVATVGQTSLLGFDARGARPAAGRSAERPSATGRHDRSEQFVDLPVDRTDAVVAVRRRQRRRARADRRHRPQLQHRTDRTRDVVRDLLTRLDTFVGTLDQQRDNIIASIDELNRFASTLGGQHDVMTRALNKIPPALDVLIRERPRLTTALEKLGTFSDTATGLVNDTQADLVTNLQNLEPTLKALADVGPDIDTALAYIPTFPLTQNLIDRGVRGDYINLFVTVDLTTPESSGGFSSAPGSARTGRR